MPIITISRGSGSGGQVLAEGVAQRLGYDVVSREEIVREAARFGAPEDGLRRALLRPPGLWDRFNHERRRYLAFVQAALAERVRGGQVVYHGNAGHLLLPGIDHVVCVRLIAPLEFRVRMLRERSGMTEDEALDHIHEVDRQRERWTLFLYGVDWLDPHLYDLSINLRTLEVEDAVDLVAVLSRAARFQPTEASRRSLEDLVLASRVRAALAADPRTASAEVRVRAEGGEVVLAGRLRSTALVDAALDVAGGVDGVAAVDRDNLDALPFIV
ncbi:MAG TPA: cytidylate kinase family protein [Longimicrobiales bacterium]|nr:cytidylate kinase family protein [Longimicrobiales bacterium]